MVNQFEKVLSNLLRRHLHQSEQDIVSVEGVSGGDIHSAYRVNLVDQVFFVKANQGSEIAVLRSEFESLMTLSDMEIGQFFPVPCFFDVESGYGVLAMQYIKMSSITTSESERCARDLVRVHSVIGHQFGWHCDNFIGSTAQENSWYSKWDDFFIECRLKPLIQMWLQKDQSSSLIRNLENALPLIRSILSERQISPRLVHGDLWVGNLAFNESKGQLSLYDPAPYYGDPWVDIAMTKMFGSLDHHFYEKYHEFTDYRPVDIERLESIYTLYHAINHLLIFGYAYENLVKRTLNRILCDN